MNAVTLHRPTRATRFTAWRVTEKAAQPHPLAAQTLAEIEREIATEAYHGDTFLIREDDAIRERTTLHVYRVRRGKWTGCHGPDARRVYVWVADRLLSVPVRAFDPVEPWRYVPGCDPVGRSGVIEGARI
jgi:hypothetical protein